jgi:hypothetical protein
VGFNYQQPGRIKKADWIMLGAAVVIVVALVVWVVR